VKKLSKKKEISNNSKELTPDQQEGGRRRRRRRRRRRTRERSATSKTLSFCLCVSLSLRGIYDNYRPGIERFKEGSRSLALVYREGLWSSLEHTPVHGVHWL